MWGSGNHNDPWLVVRTHWRREEQAFTHSTRQGCQCFLPMIYDEAKKKESVFFPGFLFLRPPSPSIRFLDSTYGISQVLRFGEQMATIRDKELRGIFDRAEVIDGVRAIRITIPGFERGQKLRVRCGHLINSEGQFQRYRPGDRTELLVEILGQKSRLVVPNHWVEKAA
jgi:transcription antitermination factor NusG